jgi:hypothetical protein
MHGPLRKLRSNLKEDIGLASHSVDMVVLAELIVDGCNCVDNMDICARSSNKEGTIYCEVLQEIWA